MYRRGVLDKGKKVWLSINSKIYYEDDDPQEYILKTEGNMFYKDEYIYIMYEESELSGMKGDKTLLKIGRQYFSMRRYGRYTSELVFTPKIETSTFYNTPQGKMSMYCHTDELDVVLEPLCVKIQYDLMIGGFTKSKNVLKIELIGG